LVVDDEPDITFTLQAVLEDGGFNVDAFIDPELVLSSFKPGLYDLVLINIMMPKMDGFALYERLKKVDPGVKIRFLTVRCIMKRLEKKSILSWITNYSFKSQYQLTI
jgi:DNA-binding response OmpR family regulator